MCAAISCGRDEFPVLLRKETEIWKGPKDGYALVRANGQFGETYALVASIPGLPILPLGHPLSLAEPAILDLIQIVGGAALR